MDLSEFEKVKLVFRNPVFKVDDLNITVRPGTDLAVKLELGEKLRVEDDLGVLVGTAEVEGIMITHLETVPSSWLLCDHDPACRDLTGLIREMKKLYGDTCITQPVTVVLFMYRPVEGT